ncbi:DUF3164 family protein [Vibrio mediterranei]
MNKTTKKTVPEGYIEDRKGRLVPVSNVSGFDMEMHEFVKRELEKAKEEQQRLREFKVTAFGNCYAFLDLLAEKYNRTHGGAKGNVTFSTFDGKQQVQISIQDSLVFGPELQIAKDIIDECLSEWSEGANVNLKAIVADAFEIDKEGNLNTGRILSLRKHAIEDARWQQAMTAIGDSILVASSKPYIRFKERDSSGKMVNVPLDIAAL